MHAQRCPVAKLRAASQQQQQGKVAGKAGDKRLPAPSDAKKKQDKSRRSQLSKTQERQSFFQNVHGDAAPLLPPHPQMYSEEPWAPPRTRPPAHPGHPKEAPRPKRPTPQVYSKDHTVTRPQPTTHHLPYKDSKPLPQLYYKEAANNSRLKETVDRALIFNENCVVHGPSKPFRYSIPKSMSCPSSRQTTDVERLKNWRRNSLTLTPSVIAYNSSLRPHSSSPVPSTTTTAAATPTTREKRPRPLSQGHELPPLPPGRMVTKQRLPSRTLSPPATITSPSSSQAKNVAQTDDPQGRRSQFRRAWSLFSIGCHENHKKAPPQSILRQPTRHIYRRGISGLPVECTNRDMGLVF
ncbi:WAS/WASL-interacting protein family member 1-like [Eriocheir sinensis]|uniref:WAS/WASL-interacting protein family member 1-like n=1 Tax=Eriocheir sinensis TaxID=95602 RepID=UPI0021C76275|nr:WAS/WASL-interacting protein family member 1-like [Eriocheir sinensis]XP_050701014.1 WAS/WASL-interacting protein family member 1-like [Eriocheir sinensis]